MENNERAYKDELVQKISDLFLTFGLRSTSMDDIANHLKISKKTLYQYFGNKDDVVEQVMLFRIYDKRGRSELGETERQNPIAVIGYVKRFVINMLDTRIPANDFDMKKYHPAVYAKVKAAHEKLTKDFLSSLLDQGIKAGYFRPDIDRDLQIYLLNTPLQYLGDPELGINLPYPIPMVVCTILDNFMRAIATEKGLREIEKYEAEQKTITTKTINL